MAPTSQHRFEERLQRLVRRARLRMLGHGLFLFLAAAASVMLAAVWVASGPERLGGFLAWGLSLSLALVLGSLLWTLILRRVLPMGRRRRFVRELETRGNFNNLLVAAEEACRLPGRWRPTADEDGADITRELRHRMYLRAAELLENLPLEQVIPLRRTRSGLVALGLVAVLGTGLVLTDSGAWPRGLDRLTHPRSLDPLVMAGGIYVVPGPGFVVAGQDLTVSAQDFGGGLDHAVCEIRQGSGLWQEMNTTQAPVFPVAPYQVASHRRWTAEIDGVREGFAWRFRRGGRVSQIQEVVVRHHPLLTELGARVDPPAYTRTPGQDLTALPTWLEVPAGSTLQLEGKVNHQVIAARLVQDQGDTLVLDRQGLQIGGQIRIDTDVGFTIELEDEFGLRNLSPLRYEVSAASDAVPVVRLERPGDDGILPLSGALELVVEAADDFGLASLEIQVRTVSGTGLPLGQDRTRERSRGIDSSAGLDFQTGWAGGVFWPEDPGRWLAFETPAGLLRVKPSPVMASGQDLLVRFQLEVQADNLDLMAGDALEIVARATDSKEPPPAGVGVSHVLRLVLPSAADVLADQAQANETKRSDLEEMRRRSLELGSDLDRLTRELMKNPIPDWARQQEMEAAIDRQKTLQEELARVAQQLRQELENLASSQLTSREQLEKADEMSQLLAKKRSAHLEELLRKMEEGAAQLSPQDVSRAIHEVAREQKNLARKLDAALAMLKRMSEEQELEGLTSLLEKLMQKQQELADLSRQLAEQQKAEASPDEGEPGDQAEQADQTAPEDQNPESPQTGQDDPSSNQDQEHASEGDSAEDKSSEQDKDPGESPGQENHSGKETPAETQDMPTAEELAQRQEALKEELQELLEQLERALADLQQERQERQGDPQGQQEMAQGDEQQPQEPGQESSPSGQMEETMQKALEQLKQQLSEGNMDKAQEQLQQMDPEQAARLQEQALRDLGSLYHVFLQSQEAMQMAMEQQQVTSLRQLAADMLALSSRQEEIALRIPTQLREVRSQDLTRSQHRLQKATLGVRDGLSQLMSESPLRIIKLLDKLDNLIETMGHGVNAMEENRGPVAQRRTRDALSTANNIVIGLLTEAQISSQGGGGGSKSQQSMADKLMEMIKQQAELNGTTDELRKMLANRGLSQETRAQMERLGGSQGDLARQMGEMAEEERGQPEGDRLLGDLGELGREMERVTGDIDQGLVSEETLVRQQRILSRMLDARNSVRQRDYSSRRESHTAGRLFEDQQRGLRGPDGLADDERFRLRYQPLEKAPLEYRDLVRRYFSALDSLRRQDEALGGLRNRQPGGRTP